MTFKAAGAPSPLRYTWQAGGHATLHLGEEHGEEFRTTAREDTWQAHPYE